MAGLAALDSPVLLLLLYDASAQEGINILEKPYCESEELTSQKDEPASCVFLSQCSLHYVQINIDRHSITSSHDKDDDEIKTRREQSVGVADRQQRH